MIGKCCACDRKLTPAECGIERDMCPECRAEMDAGYAANRLLWLDRLVWRLRMRLVAQSIQEAGEN